MFSPSDVYELRCAIFGLLVVGFIGFPGFNSPSPSLDPVDDKILLVFPLAYRTGPNNIFPEETPQSHRHWDLQGVHPLQETLPQLTMSLLERGFSGYQGTVTDWYAYNPIVGAAVAATALYAVVLVVQGWQMFRHKAWIWFVMVVAVASTLLPPAAFLATQSATWMDINALTFVFSSGMLRLWYQNRVGQGYKQKATIRRAVRLDRVGTRVDDGYHLRDIRAHRISCRSC